MSDEELIEAMAEALEECAADLAEYVAAHYGRSAEYTSMKAKYARDMEPVLRARALLARVKGEG